MWDYKERRPDDHDIYQDFGNFNFGVTGAAQRHLRVYQCCWGVRIQVPNSGRTSCDV